MAPRRPQMASMRPKRLQIQSNKVTGGASGGPEDAQVSDFLAAFGACPRFDIFGPPTPQESSSQEASKTPRSHQTSCVLVSVVPALPFLFSDGLLRPRGASKIAQDSSRWSPEKAPRGLRRHPRAPGARPQRAPERAQRGPKGEERLVAGVACQAIRAWSRRPSHLVWRRALLARRIVIEASCGNLGMAMLCQAMLYQAMLC